MKQKSRWEKCRMKCPEENIETELKKAVKRS
jgi:hypothetical protein